MGDAQRMLIEDTIDGVQQLLTTTERDALFAEEHINDTEAYNRAKLSRDTLYATYIEAEFNL